MTYRCLHNKVLVLADPNEEEVLPSGLVVPDLNEAPSAIGTVVSAGPGCYSEIEVGSRVLFQPYLAAASWSEDGQRLVLLEDDNVYGVMDG